MLNNTYEKLNPHIIQKNIPTQGNLLKILIQSSYIPPTDRIAIFEYISHLQEIDHSMELILFNSTMHYSIYIPNDIYTKYYTQINNVASSSLNKYLDICSKYIICFTMDLLDKDLEGEQLYVSQVKTPVISRLKTSIELESFNLENNTKTESKIVNNYSPHAA